MFIRAYTPSGGQPNVTIMDADGANHIRLSTDEGDANPCWSPDGSRIAFERSPSFFSRNQLWMVNPDGTSLTLVKDSLGISEISWTPQDKFLGIDGLGIAQVNLDGTGKTRILNLTPGTAFDLFPRMSPDGTRIVFQWSGGGVGSQIYSVSADGSDLQQLTGTTGVKWYPVWSKDGMKIAFTSGQDGSLAIWLMDPDGSNQVRVSPSPGGDYLGDWR